MFLDIQFSLRNNPSYIKYLRYNSYWYKILNRNPFLIDDFIREVKEKYKLRTTDKINDIMDKIDMVSKFINVLR
mgnify:CR=1 FL=1